MKGNNRGITLIALVVTIIVLLILASVSIRLLLGDNGILTKSSFAAFAEEMSSVEEQVILARGAEQTGAILDGTEDTITISEDGVFVAKYNDEQITDKLKRDIVELRENNRDSGMSQEEINAKYEALKNAEGNIDGLLYINKKYAKGKDRTYLFDIKTNTAIKVPGKIIDGVEYHIYKWNTGSAVLATVPKPEGPDLSEHKPLEDGWIPIYTIENYKKVATEEQNYDIYDLSGTKIGTYNMNKDAKYRMMNDIDFASETNVDTIKGFKGIFDGNGYYIKNIKIDTKDSTDIYYYYSKDNMMTSDSASTIKIGTPTGLFDRIDEGKVQNLGIDGATIVGNAVKETEGTTEKVYGSNVGILAGEIVGATIENCIVKNSSATSKVEVEVTNAYYKQNKGPVGALVGWSYNKESTISKIGIDNVNILGTSITSGLVAMTTGDINISECLLNNSEINMQTFNNTTSESQAGLLGFTYADKMIIDNCYVGKTKFINNINTTSSEPKNTCGGIFGGLYQDYNNQQVISITNSGVEDLVFPVASNEGGICGNTGFYNTKLDLTISGCVAKNIKLKGVTLGGIIGYVPGTIVKIEKCDVINLETNEDYILGSNRNKGGIVGSAYYPTDFVLNYCNVYNSNLVTYDAKDNMTITAGIIGAIYASSDMKDTCIIKNCNVENTNIKTIIEGTTTSYYMNCKAVGIVGWSAGIDVDNCKINNSYIILESKNEPKTVNNSTGDLSSGFAAGIVGDDLFGKETANISNCKIANTEIKSNYSCAMGMYGWSSKNVNITNCDIENSIIKGRQSATGGLNYAYYGKKIVFDECNIMNCEIISEKRNASGYINMIYGDSGSIIKNCNVEGSKLQNLEYVPNGTSESYGALGGIAAYMQTANIEGCTVTDTTLNNHYKNTGGIIGGYQNGNIKDCIVKNTKITSKEESVGGIVGNAMSSPSNITNCTVEDVIINSEKALVGGIQGCGSSSNQSIENCNIKGVEINTEDGLVGGVIGLGSSGTKLNNNNVENIKINAKTRFVGGIAGICSGSTYYDTNITNCNVKSSIISSEGSAVGGLIGNKFSYGSVDTCSVTSTQISGKDAAVGGLIGEYITISVDNSEAINNCKVENCKVTLEGADAKGAGGIVGNGSNIYYKDSWNEYVSNSIIKECKVLGTEITGVDYVGGISGVAVTNIENCLVDNKTTITGRNAVGGIQGFGGILGEESIKYMAYRYISSSVGYGWKEQTVTPTEYYNVTIKDSQINNSTITGNTGDYFQGQNSYYVDGYTGTTGQDTITNCSHKNVTLNIKTSASHTHTASCYHSHTGTAGQTYANGCYLTPSSSGDSTYCGEFVMLGNKADCNCQGGGVVTQCEGATCNNCGITSPHCPGGYAHYTSNTGTTYVLGCGYTEGQVVCGY